MLLNEGQLKEYGKKLGAELKPGAVIALTGELGAGKTTLAKAIAAGAGVTETVTSPTFTLINEYKSGRLPLYHFDVYRLGDNETEKTLSEIGYEEYFFGDGVTVIEWADRIKDLLPEYTIWIGLSHTDNPGLREVKGTGTMAGLHGVTETSASEFERNELTPQSSREERSKLRAKSSAAVTPAVVPAAHGNVLAIETTGSLSSVIFRSDDGHVYYRSGDEGLMHLTSLIPMIRDVVNDAGVKPEDISGIAVSSGPGSFTGIRIGVATARAMSQTLDIPVIRVPTLETFVYMHEAEDGIIEITCPVFDARRDQMYAGAYLLEEDGRIMTLVKGGAHDPENYFRMLEVSARALTKLTKRAYGSEARIHCRFMGDGLKVFSEQIKSFRARATGLGIAVITGKEVQDAAVVLAWADAHGTKIGYEELEPIYMRKAEAQRKLEEKNAADDFADSKAVKQAGCNIRLAGEKDVYGISVIERLSFGEPWLEQSILDDIRLGYSEYIVCEDEGFLLGYVGLHRILDEGHITNIAVHPSVRGQGVGSAVLGELINSSEHKGIREFTLEVRDKDEMAIRFYEKHGFVSEGIRKDYYPKEGAAREDARIMWRRDTQRFRK